MSRLTDVDKIKLDYSGLAYISPNDFIGIAKYFADQIKSAPTVDAVLIGTYDQVRWERDTAIDQLREIGKDFGAKMDDVAKVVRCKDCKFHHKGKCAQHSNQSFSIDHHGIYFYVYDDFFCAEGKRKEGGQND